MNNESFQHLDGESTNDTNMHRTNGQQQSMSLINNSQQQYKQSEQYQQNHDQSQHQAAVLSSPVVKSYKHNIAIDENRYCWVCFATDEDDELAAWVQPCKCSGTTKWVCIHFFLSINYTHRNVRREFLRRSNNMWNSPI